MPAKRFSVAAHQASRSLVKAARRMEKTASSGPAGLIAVVRPWGKAFSAFVEGAKGPFYASCIWPCFFTLRIQIRYVSAFRYVDSFYKMCTQFCWCRSLYHYFTFPPRPKSIRPASDLDAEQLPLWQIQVAGNAKHDFACRVVAGFRNALLDHPDEEIRNLKAFEKVKRVRLVSGQVNPREEADLDQIGVQAWNVTENKRSAYASWR